MKPAKPFNPVPTVSRIGQHGKRPMAKQIKEKPDLKKTSQTTVDFFREALRFVRTHFLFVILLLVFCSVVSIAMFTPIFKIKKVVVHLDEKTGCLSVQYVQQYMLAHYSMMWSHYFYSDNDLVNMHPCLEKLHVKWNLFRPDILEASVIARRPVLKVTTQVVDASGYKDAETFFNAAVISEDLRYMLTDGHLVQLDAEPQVPHITLRYLSSTQLDSIHFERETIIALLQLSEYISKEYGFTPELHSSDTGIVRFSMPVARNVVVSLREDIAKQLGSLQAILSTSTIDRSNLESIDVRTGNAVLRYTR